MKWISLIFNLIFPKTCALCDKKYTFLCRSCKTSLTQAKPSNHPWITSLYDYHDDRVNILIRYIKNHPHKQLIKLLLKNHTVVIDYDIIIPIPLHSSRMRERGFNQSYIIARALSNINHEMIKNNILIKSRKTEKQGTRSSREERIVNSLNSFVVIHPKKIVGKRILLVDDVTTTGSTLIAARSALLQAGAKEVVAFTLAN